MKNTMKMTTLLFAVAFLAAASFAATVEEGAWINLFDGETLYGWTVLGDANWRVEEGVIVADEGDSGYIATTACFMDYELEATLRVTRNGKGAVSFRAPLAGHPKETGGDVIMLDAGEDNVSFSEVRIRVVGDEAEAWVNEHPVAVSPANAKGHIAIHYQNYHSDRGRPRIEIQEVRLRPLVMRSLFNGENLDGWNIIPDRESEFLVEDGMLKVLDGPGQIETEEVFRDFILQLDIISNGDHLNSGVFFRGPPGVWWRGYEAQIRNQWMRDDRTRPVDYGTGGIYGVNPARKVTSSDYEWFTMTVVVNDNHMAVWLDDYQVADYLDTRPVHPGADGKNGYVPDAGTIHLQGHDPATDLDFKNIHIQEYPVQ